MFWLNKYLSTQIPVIWPIAFLVVWNSPLSPLVPLRQPVTVCSFGAGAIGADGATITWTHGAGPSAAEPGK